MGSGREMLMRRMSGRSLATMFRATGLAGVLFFGAVGGGGRAGVASAPQGKDNPEFAYWSNCKVGSWVKMKLDVIQGGQKIEAELTVKLLELTAEKAVLERSGKVTTLGKTVEMPADKDEVKAKVDEPDKIVKEGDEEVEVAGKKLKCHWVEVAKTEEGAKVHSKAWMTKEIPGGVAKMESKPEGAKEPSQKFVALSWEKK
jgi:hypothetical protein